MWPNPQETADLVTFTKEILNGKLYFLCSEKGHTNECFLYSPQSYLYVIKLVFMFKSKFLKLKRDSFLKVLKVLKY